MNAPPDTPPSKGMAMIAAYRAARLRQRPVLRTSLHQSHAARRAARCGGSPVTEPEGPLPDEAVPAPTLAVPVAETVELPSVFASLVNLSSTEPLAQEEPVADPPTATVYDPPLAEIGFGPGMLIRLSQLGLHTTRDLANADAEQLRAELGDISRLVDVEAWISSARASTMEIHMQSK